MRGEREEREGVCEIGREEKIDRKMEYEERQTEKRERERGRETTWNECQSNYWFGGFEKATKFQSFLDRRNTVEKNQLKSSALLVKPL